MCSHRDPSSGRNAERTLVLHEPPDLFPSPQVPHLHDLIRAPRSEPFASLRRSRNGFDAGHMCREDEDGFQVEGVLGRIYRDCALKAVEQLLVRADDDLERCGERCRGAGLLDFRRCLAKSLGRGYGCARAFLALRLF